MGNETPIPLQDRVNHLERRLRILGIATSVMAIGLTLTAWFAVRPGSVRADDSDKILRVRGLIIEDASGRARILLGAPVPKVGDRKRADDASGMIVLDANGADRVTIGSPIPGPQVGGKVYSRIAAAAGIQIDDPDGNERGGFGYLANDRVVLGLDYPGREGLMLAVMDGGAGITLNASTGTSDESAGLYVMKSGVSGLELSDKLSGPERTTLLVQDESAARLFGILAKDKSTDDVAVSWLSPQTGKHLDVKINGPLLNAIENLKP
jgi:hypothetical protein